MDQLIKLVSEKAGIPESTARTAVKTVVDYLKKNLPQPIAAQVDRVLADDETVAQVADQAEDLIQGLGKGFGKKE
ncbi:MAG: DUF2267 domain-containing protein [Anaerolineae bacterium]